MTKVLLDCPLCEIALLVLHSPWCLTMTQIWVCFPLNALIASFSALTVLSSMRMSRIGAADGVGLVFVSGEERETTANETGPAAISLSGVCDRPFAVPLCPRTFFYFY